MANLAAQCSESPYIRRIDILIRPDGRMIVEEYVEGFSARGHFKLGGGRWMS
jgi:hypothetical protein